MTKKEKKTFQAASTRTCLPSDEANGDPLALNKNKSTSLQINSPFPTLVSEPLIEDFRADEIFSPLHAQERAKRIYMML